MSIIMSRSALPTTAPSLLRESDEIAPNVRSLLDHIAVELAREYVRLMEESAREDEHG